MKKTIILGLIIMIFLSSSVYGALNDNLLYYMDFNNNFVNSITNETGNNTGSVNVTGKIMDGRHMRNTNEDYISYTTALGLTGNPSFSINLWVYSSSTASTLCPGLDPLIGWGNTSQNNLFGLLLNRNSAFNCNDGTDTRVVVDQYITNGGTGMSGLFSFNNWFMISVVKNASNFMIFINGTNVQNYTMAGSDFKNNTLQIGHRPGISNQATSINIDEVGIWNRILSSSEISQLYNNGTGLNPTIIQILNIFNVNCTSAGPSGNTTSPYTADTTPTFSFNTSILANCRISDRNFTYSSMNDSRNCTTGQGTINHICTLTSQDELVTPSDYVYVVCNNTYNETSVALLIDVQNLASNSSRYIDYGITNSVIGSGATIYSNQKVYLRALNGSSKVATVDKVAVYGNQRWLIHYENETESPLGLFNITPVVYVLEMKNISLSQIRNTVTAFINNTKI
jgi:hypothetical protein